MDTRHWPEWAELTCDEFRALCRELAVAVGEGSAEVIEQTYPLDHIMQEGKWVDDMMRWKILNRLTGKVYVLDADTYHGRCSWHIDRSNQRLD